MTSAGPIDALLERKRAAAEPGRRPPGSEASLRALRAWQSSRLAGTYRDFRADPGYAPALQFFLSDLYGPQESTARDRDLARAWFYLKRTLPAAMLGILGEALELDVLSLELDLAMVRALGGAAIDADTYAAAYRAVGSAPARARQVELIASIGTSLGRVVRHAWIGALLHAAHVPAHAAGFGVLQDFLERGYAAFRGMHDPGRLVDAIREREGGFMRKLFGGECIHE